MGTRGAIGFRIGGVDKIFYNHYDSYPDGIGKDVVVFARTVPANYAKVRKQVEDLRAIVEGEKPSPAVIAKAKKMKIVDLGVSNQSTDDWYCVLRGAQGDLKKSLEIGVYTDNASFLKDSLFCEYAYIINFDTTMIEFYQGFNKDRKAAGRYAALAPKTEMIFDRRPGAVEGAKVRRKVEYAGVRLVGEAPLGDIPKDWIKKFYPPEKE